MRCFERRLLVEDGAVAQAIGRLSSCAWSTCACLKRAQDLGVLDYIAAVAALLAAMVIWRVVRQIWCVVRRIWSAVRWYRRMVAAAGARYKVCRHKRSPPNLLALAWFKGF